MDSILITGGAGFIGSHLCSFLLEAGMKVICIDNLTTGSLENIRELQKHDHFSFINHDVAIKLPEIKTDYIINLASPASPVQYKINPVYTIKTNVLGAINVLELATKTSARVLQASTSEIYGDPLVHPQHEGYYGNVNTIGSRSCYDEGKRCAETLFADYSRRYGTDVRIARIFNTYGPKMAIDDGRVVSNFIISALKNEPLSINGDGAQTRSFCYVEDQIQALSALLFTAKADFSPINLGNPAEISIIELAQMVIDLCESNSEIIFMPEGEDDPKKRKPDIEKAKALLDWQPQIHIDEGLTKTISYFRKILEKP